jgi:RNA polymerase sigma-70 factor (ECF subfamily)
MENLMSMQHCLPDRVVDADARTLYCRECSQQMWIAVTTPGRDEGETYAYECACGHRESNNMGRPTIERSTLQPPERDAMLAVVPNLRAFAISLSGNVDRADDLVQETLLRAIANINSFQPGTNMQAWLFTILRNFFRSEFRRRRREVEDTDGSHFDRLESRPEQHGRLEFGELSDALAKLPFIQREALLLVGASGFSYNEAAAICETAVGTIKSRVNRARERLAELLMIDKRAAKVGPKHRDRGSEQRREGREQRWEAGSRNQNQEILLNL